MNILITGAHGFIGKALTSDLQEVSTLPRRLLSKPGQLRRFIQDRKFTHVIHLAAYGNMAHQNELNDAIKVNYLQTNNLLAALLGCPLESVIFTSSSSVYGKKKQSMNTSDIIKPESAYAVTKAAAEHLCQHYITDYKMPIKIARLFSVYGPGEASFRFIPTIIRKIKENKTLTYSAGVHDWIYIDDVVFCLKHLLHHEKPGIYNIGTGDQFSNYEVVNILREIARSKAKRKRITIERKYDSPVWRAGDSLLHKVNLAYTDIVEGLQLTYERSG